MTAVGGPARDERAAALDGWLAGLLAQLGAAGAALVALGGLGRRECAPYGDLDLVLLHGGPAGIAAVAERIWYPVWDAGLTLDHSVRTLDEALAVAAVDTRVALGLLDARHLAGDPALTGALRAAASASWRCGARSHLPTLAELTTERWRREGELAFLLDGDLKQARGGLRDVRVLRGIGYAQVSDAWRAPVRAAYTRLLDVRDGLHLVAGRRRDRMLGQDLPEVAGWLGLPAPDAVRRRVADDARTIAYAVDDALRAAQRWLAGPPAGGRGRGPRTPIAPDVVDQGGEAVLARTAVTPTVDGTLALRVAAAAAGQGLPISPGTLEWLAARCPPPPRPWPAAALGAFTQLLGSGPALVPTWEACDRYGLVSAWLPEWNRVRSAPQHNPVHRYTLDRHLIECVAASADHTREVSRPDLLLIGALLHDIGKGLPGDHSRTGIPVATGIAQAIGLAPGDVATIADLVRWHLLLPEVATRRDLDDPQTVRQVAETVGDLATLELLHALSQADAAATGPAAWSTWKERLVAELVSRVRVALVTGGRDEPAPLPGGLAWPTELSASAVLGWPTELSASGPLPSLQIGSDRVAVAAEDRPGLLAAVAGCLTLHRLEVVAADTATVAGARGPVAMVSCRVQPREGTGPDGSRLAADLRKALIGELELDRALDARVRSARRPSIVAPAPRVVWAVDRATDATILELRAADDVGLLYRVAHALELAGANVRAARISTLGADVVDAFYLVGDWSGPAERSTVEQAVLAAAQSRSG